MDFKKYLLEQSAINLQYIAEKMWPTNTNAKTYLSRKLNDGDRQWTALDNDKARKAIHELGLQLIKDAPLVEVIAIEKPKSVKSKKPVINSETKKTETIWEKMDRLREEDKPGAVKTNN